MRLAIQLFLVTLIAGLPHAVAGLWWYPCATDDAHYYVYQAGLLLPADSFLASPLDPATRGLFASGFWVLMAIVTRLTDTPLMSVFRALGYIGAFLLPLYAGVFTYLATGRRRVAVLAVFVAGLWGGLAGYHWLLRVAIPCLARGELSELVMHTDFFTPRHFGEYRGPNSTLVSYLSDFPLYPRELGLCLFWISLGCILQDARLHRSPRVSLALCGFIGAIAIYPHYSLPAGAMCLWICYSAIKYGRSRTWGLVTSALVLTTFLAVAVLLLRVVGAYYALDKAGIVGVFDIARERFRVANTIDPLTRPPAELRFSLTATLASHFFLVAAAIASVVLARCDRGKMRTPVSSTLSLYSNAQYAFVAYAAALVVVAIVLSETGSAFNHLTRNYGYLIFWRALATPLVVMAAALGADSLIRWGSGCLRRRLAVALLLLLPCLSPLHWTVNSIVFQTMARGTDTVRGRETPAYLPPPPMGHRVDRGF